MVWIPPQLKDVASRLEERPQVTVRTLLSWFNAERRGANIVSLIQLALRTLDLQTAPNFEDVWIDATVGFERASAASGAATPPPSAAEISPSTERSDAEATPAVADTSGRRRDPVHRVGKLDAANRSPVAIAPDAPVREAMTVMMLNDFSQLPVMTGERSCRGAITWKSIGKRFAMGGPMEFVRDCMDPAPICSADDNVFDVAADVFESDFVVVQASDRRVQGLITTADLSRQFGALLEPFLLIGEIENHIRLLLDERLPIEMIRAARDPSDLGRDVQSASSLSFGEYRRLLEREDAWTKLGLPLDQKRFVKALEPVREIRNDVMHFHPEGIGDAKLRQLRDFAGFMREIHQRR